MTNEPVFMQHLSADTRHLIAAAQAEAQAYRQPLVGTEHVLLGLIRTPGSIAAHVLESLNVTQPRTQEAVELLAGRGPLRHAASNSQANWTQRVHDIFDLADRLRRALGARSIEPEHVLLALLDVPGNAALGVLQTLGVEREQLRSITLAALQQSATPRLTHLDDQGQAHMVDVGAKLDTAREAIARGTVTMQPETLTLIMAGELPKGDVLATARIAGIMAAKKTSDLIPLCHPLLLTHVGVTVTPNVDHHTLAIEATVRTSGKTGVEMEALTAVSVAALTIYDMCKAVDRGMRISEIRLAEKRGGKSGEIVLE